MITSGRREARERALELLYEAGAKGLEPADVILVLPAQPDPYAAELALGVHDDRDRLDEVLSRTSHGWSLDRMPAVDLALLRIAAWELAHRPDVPVGVVISEAVELAKRFSTDDSGRFVNGVLGRLAAELRPASTPAVPAPATAPGSAPTDIAWLILDVDGVIRFWDEAAVADLATTIGVSFEGLVGIAFEPALLRDALTGALTDEEWRSEVGRRVAEHHDVEAATVTELWAAVGWRIDDEVVDLIAEVRRSVPVALFSNATTRLEADLQACGVAAAVDKVVNSARIGLAKPDPEAYRAVAASIAQPTAQCLFVDDRPDNVTGARLAGMQAAVYTDVEALRALLAAAGVLDGAIPRFE